MHDLLSKISQDKYIVKVCSEESILDKELYMSIRKILGGGGGRKTTRKNPRSKEDRISD